MLSCLQVTFALLLQPPAYFGYMHFDMAEFSIDKIIGQGAHTYVFEVSRGNEETCALKVFMKSDEYDTELSNLKQLHGILQNKFEFNHVPKMMNFQMMVTETISGMKYGSDVLAALCTDSTRARRSSPPVIPLPAIVEHSRGCSCRGHVQL